MGLTPPVVLLVVEGGEARFEYSPPDKDWSSGSSLMCTESMEPDAAELGLDVGGCEEVGNESGKLSI